MEFEKIIVITKKTDLEELINRFNTKDQARFYIEHMGGDFDEYEKSHDYYAQSLNILKKALPKTIRYQFIDRSFLPMFTFGKNDLVITLGPDGLVVNTAKYLSDQSLLAFNPDPSRIDGILLPFYVLNTENIFKKILTGKFSQKHISMARAELNNGQSLHALNDFFLGHQSHVSARYYLYYRDISENQSSSGIIISTGAGSTGWFRSIITGASGIVKSYLKMEKTSGDNYRFDWEADYLYFAVREPFISKTSTADLIFGKIEKGYDLQVISHMPQNGVIFSDGIESDYLEFNSGTSVRIGLSEKKLHLITGLD